MKKQFKDRLIEMGACREAVKWVGRKSMTTAWKTCKRGDWMMWLIERSDLKNGSPEHMAVIRCAIDFAKMSLPIWEKYDPKDMRPHEAIEAAEIFINEWASRSAAYSAYSAADSADRSAADSADRSAAYLAQANIIRKHFPECPFND